MTSISSASWRPALGHVPGGQRGDGERLAGAGAGLQHGGADRQRAAHVERLGRCAGRPTGRLARVLAPVARQPACRTTSSASSSGDQSAAPAPRTGWARRRPGRAGPAARPARRPAPQTRRCASSARSARAAGRSSSRRPPPRPRSAAPPPAGPARRRARPPWAAAAARAARRGRADQLGQRSLRAAPGRPVRARALRQPVPAAAADGDRAPTAARCGRGQRQQPDPGPEPLLGRQPGVLDPQQIGAVGAVHAADGADQSSPSGSATSTSTSAAASPAAAGSAAATSGSTSSRTAGRAARRPSAPGGSSPRRHSACRHRSGRAPASRSRSSRSPTAQAASPSSSTGSASARLVALAGERDSPTRCRRNALDRVLEEAARSSSSTTRVDRGAGQRRGQERRPGAACGRAAASAPASSARSKLNGRPARERAGGEVARVERLQRMPHDHLLRARAVRLRPVDRVEQLAERHRGRTAGPVRSSAPECTTTRCSVAAQDRVEQQLAVLAARVALADQRVAGQHVVAVGHAGAREGAVVQPEQADHPVRHRAHRHQRAHREAAGAEVGPGRAAAQPLGQQRRARRPARAARCRRCGPAARGRRGQLGAGLRGLPGVGVGGVGERVERRRSSAPTHAGQRLLAAQRAEHRGQPVDELGQPPDQVDVAGVHVVERQRGAQP